MKKDTLYYFFYFTICKKQSRSWRNFRLVLFVCMYNISDIFIIGFLINKYAHLRFSDLFTQPPHLSLNLDFTIDFLFLSTALSICWDINSKIWKCFLLWAISSGVWPFWHLGLIFFTLSKIYLQISNCPWRAAEWSGVLPLLLLGDFLLVCSMMYLHTSKCPHEAA